MAQITLSALSPKELFEVVFYPSKNPFLLILIIKG